MELFVLKKNKKIDMSTLSIKQQLSKITEEYMEVIQAGYHESKRRVASECLDLIQASVGLLDVLKREGVDIEAEILKHNAKLDEREWEYKGVLTIILHKVIQQKKE